MKASTLALASAIAGAMAISASAFAQSGPAASPTYKFEKCYGVSKAGKNDCQTANSSCAGTSKKDGQADAWIYLPAGSCERLVGGSLKSS
jgi:uncharacterized membrane protein